MSDGIQSCDTLAVVLKRLNETHDVSAYEAVDRLLHVGQATGFDTCTLLRMLDEGTTLQTLLDLIVSKAVPISNSAPLESRRNPEPLQRVSMIAL